jgi:hypothetical protein
LLGIIITQRRETTRTMAPAAESGEGTLAAVQDIPFIQSQWPFGGQLRRVRVGREHDGDADPGGLQFDEKCFEELALGEL